jgi:hypothetical protein
MAKFLETQAISNELMRLIKEAKEKIILISPYLKVNAQIQERIKTKSKIGTLSEIVIVYGKSELKESELHWIKEIEDLKVYEKPNLHAKCYLNEEKAIICSMNLYEYSQQNNIEMGLMITKQHDADAYNELVEEINNIKVNGIRRKFNEEVQIAPPAEATKKATSVDVKKPLTAQQQLKFEILKDWRKYKSKEEKSKAYEILTDDEISNIAYKDNITANELFGILPKKSAIKYGDEIVSVLKQASYFTIGKVINVWYQNSPNAYDRVKLKLIESGEEKWFDTTQELPNIDTLVAAKLNKSWFNEYLYLNPL